MHEHLKLLIQSDNPIISIESRDEEAAVDLVRGVAEALGAPLYEWSVTTGLSRTLPSPQATPVKPGRAAAALDQIFQHADGPGLREVFLFKDLGAHCQESYIQRRLRDLHFRHQVHLVMVDGAPLPDAVRRLTVPVRLPLPDHAALEQAVRDTFRRVRETSVYKVTASLTRRDLEQLVQTLRGLTVAEASRVVAAAIHDDYALTPDDLPRIVEAKRNLLQSAGCLESISVNITSDELGGLANLKRWLAQRRGGMSPQAREYGLESPRGLLLLGVPGCGKSLCAKAVAADWHMPLLRMDPGVLYQKFVGESENRLREALDQAEAMAPAVLWIDEIEKAFASAASESADGGLSQRMFGTLLSWMQDHRSPVFITATANKIEALPPELMRKGRFDEIFFVDLPEADVRRQILAIHLARRKRAPEHFDLEALAEATAGFSGAELEQMVLSALYAAFAEEAELTDAHLLAEARATQPLAVVMGERVEYLRSWAEGRCVPAD